MQITHESIQRHHPDVLLPPDDEFADRYAELVREGRKIAAGKSVAFVAIVRNAQPWLELNLQRLEETASMFRSWRAYAFENDSTDGTKTVLQDWADGYQRKAVLNHFDRPHLCGEKSQRRTVALAEYRTACQEWVRRECPGVDYVVVFDSDSWGGWSVDGVAAGVCELERNPGFAGLASVSWCELSTGNGGKIAAQYDAWACRLNHFSDRGAQWVHHWLPPTGSPCVPVCSAFGQLAIYRRDAYLAGEYDGSDCEHVPLHRSIKQATGKTMALCPSMRCVSFWIP